MTSNYKTYETCRKIWQSVKALTMVLLVMCCFTLALPGMAAAVTATLRPSGLAYNYEWDTYGGGGDWAVILESHDGNTSYVYADGWNKQEYFYVHMDNPTTNETDEQYIPAGSTINSFTVFFVAKYSNYSPVYVDAGYRIGGGSTTWDGQRSLPSSYTLLSTQTWTGPWSRTDIDNLQVAMMRVTDAMMYKACVTQVYVTVDYSVPGPTLAWTEDPGFGSDGVDPNSGASSATFEFRVEYTHASNVAPGTKQVWIDLDAGGSYEEDEKFTMDEVDTGDTTYTDGKDYCYFRAISHSGATLNYRFYFSAEGVDATGEPTSDHDFLVGNPPSLEWTGVDPFATDGVDPNSASSGSTFEFRVKYKDADNDSPTVQQVWVDLDDSGDYVEDEKFDMTSLGGTDYVAGVDYTKSVKVYHIGGSNNNVTLNYKFYFGAYATGDPTSDQTFTVEPGSGIYHVSPTGSSTEPYDTWAKAETSIQDAIDYAVTQGPSVGNEATVIVATGTYDDIVEPDPITLKNGVHVINKPGDKPVIEKRHFEPQIAASVTCDLRGFEIRNSTSTGILMDGGTTGDGITMAIKNCDIHDNGNAGIAMEGIISATITGCNIYNNDEAGITTVYGTSRTFNEPLAGGSSITITGCTIGDVGLGNTHAGIYLWGSGSVTVVIGGSANDANTVWYNGDAGVRLDNISDVTINNNTVSNNTKAGIVLIDAGTSGADAMVENNTICGNGKAGINIGGASYLTIQGNDIGSSTSSNLAGVVFDVGDITDFPTNDPPAACPSGPSSKPVTITANNIRYNSRGGIGVLDSISNTVTITQNNIYQNSYGGIGIQNACTLQITKNAIYNNVRGGIHTGTNVADGGGFSGSNGSANLTIRQNKVYGNGQSGYGGGIDVRHANGTLENNLVYENHRGGIRFGNWIDDIRNNTVVNCGNDNDTPGDPSDDRGGGIIYDDLAGAVNDKPSGDPPAPLNIRNNICAYNQKAGMRACFDNTQDSEERDYNLVYANNGTGESDCGYPDALSMSCTNKNFGGCGAHWDFEYGGHPVVLNGPHDIIADPLFVDMTNDDYTLQAGSPAIDAGDPSIEYNDTDATRNDMGAYGGPSAIDW